jgi:hypothetical protein
VKLQDARENYYTLSGKASDVARQLAFAGLALIWVFKTSQGAGLSLVPPPLFPPALMFAVTLALDLLQYVAAAMVWGIYHFVQERTRKDEDEFDAPLLINVPALFFFWAKFLVLAGGYALIIGWLTRQWVAAVCSSAAR